MLVMVVVAIPSDSCQTSYRLAGTRRYAAAMRILAAPGDAKLLACHSRGASSGDSVSCLYRARNLARIRCLNHGMLVWANLTAPRQTA